MLIGRHASLVSSGLGILVQHRELVVGGFQHGGQGLDLHPVKL